MFTEFKNEEHESQDISSKEACKLLNISSVTLWNWDKKGYTKPFKTPTGRRRYRRSDLKNLLVQIESKRSTQ